MSQFFVVHSTHPQQRLIYQACEILRGGGVIAYPTDSTYALGCHIGDKASMDKIRTIRRLSDQHNLTLSCRDLSEISNYARVDNQNYRILKHYLPGPFTFLLAASREVPKRLIQPKRKTIGLRVPGHPIAQALLEELGEPMMTTSLILPGEERVLDDPQTIREKLEHDIDLVIDGGDGGHQTTTVIDLTVVPAKVVREGLGVFEEN